MLHALELPPSMLKKKKKDVHATLEWGVSIDFDMDLEWIRQLREDLLGDRREWWWRVSEATQFR